MRCICWGVCGVSLPLTALATIFAVGGICSFIGATQSTRFSRPFGIGPVTVLEFLLFGFGTLLLALARGPVLVAGLFLVIWKLFEAPYSVYNINEVSLRQTVTPDRMLGRVAATFQFVGIEVFLVGGSWQGLWPNWSA